MRELRMGVVVSHDVAGGRIVVSEAQTHVLRDTMYEAGQSIRTGMAGVPELSGRHDQGTGHALKQLDVGDAVCFELDDDDAIARWGYANKFLLASERSHPSRFVPRLVTR